MTVKITTIDANKALQNHYLIKSFRRLTLYQFSGMNCELDDLLDLAKNKKINAKMVMAHINNVMVGWALMSREPSNFRFTKGLYDKNVAKKYTLVEIFINPKYRRKGIGTAILQRALKLTSITKHQPFAVAPHDDPSENLFKKIDKNNSFMRLDSAYAQWW